VQLQADPLVKKGKGKIIMISEGWKKERKEEKYHTTSKILSSLNSIIR